MKKIILIFMLLISAISFGLDFENAVNTSLGEYTNMKIKRLIRVDRKNNNYYKVHLNIDSNLFQVNARFNIDAYDFFKEISKGYDFSEVEKIALVFHDTLTDKYGNKDDYEIAEITFEINEVKKINWSNFPHIRIPDVAYHYWVHPAVNRK